MTAFFVKVFKRTNKCEHCKKEPLPGYHFCAECLEVARARFEKWAHERRNEGLCIRCDRKSFRGFLRCKLHTLLNRAQCKAWGKLHPEHAKVAWEKKKDLLAAGLCVCPAHNKLPPGFRRCNDCRARQRSYAEAAA
jgi:hypothetical protein